MLALTANRFSQRPSSLLGLQDEVVALDFDTAAAIRLYRHEVEYEAAKADNQIAALTAGIGQSSMPDYHIPDSFPTFGPEGEIPLG